MVDAYPGHREVVPSSLLFLVMAGAGCADVHLVSNDPKDSSIVSAMAAAGMAPGVSSEPPTNSTPCVKHILIQTTWPKLKPNDHLKAWYQLALRCASNVYFGCHNDLSCMTRDSEEALRQHLPGISFVIFKYGVSSRELQRRRAPNFLPIFMPSVQESAGFARNHYTVFGSVMFDKRDYDLLATLDPPEPVQITVFGSCKMHEQCNKLQALERRSNVRLIHERGSFRVMMDVIRETGWVLPLISERVARADEYASCAKMSSSISLAIAYSRPLVAWHPLLKMLGLAQISYANADSIHDAVVRSLRASAADIAAFRAELSEKRRQILCTNMATASTLGMQMRS